MAVSYSPNRVSISGSFATGDATITATTELVRTTGATPDSSWVGRLIAFVPSSTSSADTQVRLITSVDVNTVTVHDPWLDKGVLSGKFRVAHNLQDIQDIGVPELQKIGDSTYRWDGDWSIDGTGFLGDLDIALEMEKNGSGTLWSLDEGSIVQFGLLWGGENNNSVETTNGCSILFSKKTTSTNDMENVNENRAENGQVVNYYGSLIQSSGLSTSGWSFMRMNGPHRFIGCSFDGPIGGRFTHEGSEWVSCRMSGNKTGTVAWSLGATFVRPISTIIFFQNNTVMKNYKSFSGVLRDTVFTNSNGSFFHDSGDGKVDFIDCTTVPVSSNDVYQYKSVNYTTTDSDGVDLQGVTVRINNSVDDAPPPSLSDGGGVVPEILANLRRGNFTRGPFRIRIRKYGYIWSELNSNIADAIKQSVALISDSAVTQPISTALAHTGITITDHGVSPVLWQGKNFGITVKVDTAISVDDVKHYLHAVLAGTDPVSTNSSGLHWHDLIPMNGTQSARALYADGMKGVRVVDSSDNPFAGITKMQADDGTFYNAPITNTVSITNLVPNSRIRIYNATTDVELLNAVVATSSYVTSYIEGTDYSVDDVVNVRVTYKDGVVASNAYTANVIAGAAGWSVLVDQISQSVYSLFNVDGATVTEFAWDSGNLEININDADNITSIQRIGAWYFDFIYSEIGIREALGALNWNTLNAIEINTGVVDVTIDNIKAAPLLLRGGNLSRNDGATVIAATSNSIQVDYSPVYVVAVQGGSGSGASAAELVAAMKPDLTTLNNNVKDASLLIPATRELT